MADLPLLPTFIIGGAPRCGTTFLAQALDRHPDVFLIKPFVPEPKVFMGPARTPEATRALYDRLLAGASTRKARGEKTSYYLESREACGRIHQAVPGARLVFLVREPVARAYSNYLWSRQNGLETLSFEEAVENEGRRADPLPPEQAYVHPFDYVSRGDYAAGAERYYERFGRDAVAFFLYEDLIRDPDRFLRDIQRFVGVEPIPFARLDVGVVNALREPGPPLDPGTGRCLRERMRPGVARFAALTGLDVAAWGY